VFFYYNSRLANVAAFSNERMSSVEEVTATSIQQRASSQQVAILAERLSSLAAELKKSVAAFTLDRKLVRHV